MFSTIKNIIEFKKNIKKHDFIEKLKTQKYVLNHLIATLKPQSNGASYSNTLISTLAVDGWAVNLVLRRRDWRGPSPPRPLLAVPNVTAHPSTASVPTSYYSMWH